MDTEIQMKEGFISFRGYRVWYDIFGEREEPSKLPLLCLHGDPEPSGDICIVCASYRPQNKVGNVRLGIVDFVSFLLEHFLFLCSMIMTADF